jgi:hypothetical protein
MRNLIKMSLGHFKHFKNLILLFALHYCGYAFAQQGKEDVVYLKNGTIIRGTIIELKVDTTVKIMSSDRNTWVYPYKQVLKITKEKPILSPFHSKTNGFYGLLLAGVTGSNKGEFDYYYHDYFKIVINATAGYRINRFVNLGLFTGINQFDDYVVAPVGFDLRGDILKGRLTPYYAFQIGKAWCINPEQHKPIYYGNYPVAFTPGLAVHPAIGLKVNGKQSAFLAEIGFDYQELNDSYETSPGYKVEESRVFRKLSFKVGIAF